MEDEAPMEAERPLEGAAPTEAERPMGDAAPTEAERPMEDAAPMEATAPMEAERPLEGAAPTEAERPMGDAAPTETAPPTPKRPLVERLGMAAIALVLAALFLVVAVAGFAGGEVFLGGMGAIGALMTLWVGGLTLLRG